jgi:hypothetical protein
MLKSAKVFGRLIAVPSRGSGMAIAAPGEAGAAMSCGTTTRMRAQCDILSTL